MSLLHGAIWSSGSSAAAWEAETTAYQAAVIAASSTITNEALTLLDNFLKAVRTQPYGADLIWFWPQCGSNLAGAERSLLHPSGAGTRVPVFGSFSYSQSSGLQPSAADIANYADTGIIPSTHLPTASNTIGCWVHSAAISTEGYLLSCRDGSGRRLRLGHRTSVWRYAAYSSLFLEGGSAAGALSGVTAGATDQRIYHGGGTTSGNVSGNTPPTVALHAWRNNFATPDNPSSLRASLFWAFDRGLSEAENTHFVAQLTTLQQGLGRIA